ncbi:hypothetical protein AWB74_06155 [Caballeronia arvi]|uniref:Uncharacterized protein n=1 Tax=Caballeronia arvi TaxID=1777135 RepID=A0A158KLQ4_9BURK|nr:hypothetical protein [Caballeronia arvi]SAL82098.1 hypothetical protein AWB74_06155 [Caballeronia arvi]
MNMTRRTFLIASGLTWIPPGGVRASARTWVIDEDLPQSRVIVSRLSVTGARIASLSGDAGWLWIERLSSEALSSHVIGGLTRFSDAFVLAQLGAGIGMRALHHREWKAGALLWTLQHDR